MANRLASTSVAIRIFQWGGRVENDIMFDRALRTGADHVNEMQRRLDLETGVNKPFKNAFMSGAYSEFFSGRKHQFSLLFKRIFFRQI